MCCQLLGRSPVRERYSRAYGPNSPRRKPAPTDDLRQRPEAARTDGIVEATGSSPVSSTTQAPELKGLMTSAPGLLFVNLLPTGSKLGSKGSNMACVRKEKIHGKHMIVVDFRDGRGKRRRPEFPNTAEGMREARDFFATITKGKPTRREGPSFSVRQLFDGYINATEARRNEQSTQALISKLTRILRTLDSLGIRQANQLSEETFPRAKEALTAEGLAYSTIHGYLAAMRAAIRFAILRGPLDARLFGLMELEEPDQGRRRFLSKQEIGELFEFLATHRKGNKGGSLERKAQYGHLILPCALGIYQGLRRQEVCNLTGRDLDLDRGELTVVLSKTGHWRTIRLHPALRQYLPNPLPAATEWLCKNTRGRQWKGNALQHNLKRALEHLGNDWMDVTFHVLRHTCASQMAACGRHTLYEIGKFLGHTRVATTAKYAHLLPNQVAPDW